MIGAQGQSAGDNSNQYEAGRELNITHNIVNYNSSGLTADEAVAICHKIIEASMPGIEAAARKIYEQRAEKLTLDVISRIVQNDANLVSRLVEPHSQIALASAQRSFGEYGDEEVGAILAKTVADMIAEPKRDHREQLLRRSIDTLGNLSADQIRGLATICLLTKKYYPTARIIEQLAQQIDQSMKPYYGKVPKSPLEYSYLESLGLGSISITARDFGGEYDAYTVIAANNIHCLRFYYSDTDLPEWLNQSDRERLDLAVGEGFFSPDEFKAAELRKSRVDSYSGRAVSGVTEKADESKGELSVREKFVDFLYSRNVPVSELRKYIRDKHPNLADLLDALSDNNAISFSLSSVGIMIAEQELELRAQSGKPPMSDYFDNSAGPAEASGIAEPSDG